MRFKSRIKRDLKIAQQLKRLGLPAESNIVMRSVESDIEKAYAPPVFDWINVIVCLMIVLFVARLFLGCSDPAAAPSGTFCAFCLDASIATDGSKDAKSDSISLTQDTQDASGAFDTQETAQDASSDVPLRKRIFTSSETYGPNMGGLAGADAKCQALATAASLSGTYRAWLSDSKTSAKARLTHATVPYELVDGTRVAADWTDLVSGALTHAIDKTEKGTTPPTGVSGSGGNVVWTSTEASGALKDQSPKGFVNSACLDWTFVGPDAGAPPGHSVGRWDIAGAAWTDYTDGLWCASGTKIVIYCVEQ